MMENQNEPTSGVSNPAEDIQEELETRGYPPYAPYPQVTMPPTLADSIIAGRDIRQKFKYTPQKSVGPPPKPAKSKGPKATDVKISKKTYRAYSRYMRRYGAGLSDRLEYMAKPRRRNIIYMWREHANILPPETIARIRCMLDADEPFKPDQAYEYFVHLENIKKKKNKKRAEQLKKDLIALYDEKRFLWARNATIAFARGIQQRLSRPGRYALANEMLRLSNVILDNVCGFMKMKTPSRNSVKPHARFMMEMSDKIAVWIDEILMESDDRMLMMDFDEDEDIAAADGAGDAGFTMHGFGGPGSGSPSHLKFTGDMLEAFTLLTNSMTEKGEENLMQYGKFNQSYAEGAKLLKETPTFEVEEIISGLANDINQKLTDTVKELTPEKLKTAMNEIINICSQFLAEYSDINKLKGPAFKALVSAMHKKGNELLFDNGKIKETYREAAIDLDQARDLESDHDDPNLTKDIQSSFVKLVEGIVEPDMQTDMDETIDVCSKYLSQSAIDKAERGPLFDLLIKTLVANGAEPFTPQFQEVEIKFAAAHALKTAPGLTSLPANDETKPEIEQKLHKAVDLVTPDEKKGEMDDVVVKGANYLSGYIRDRGKALKLLLETMKKYASKELAKRNNYAMTYGAAAEEIEKSPVMVPYLPVKDIKQEIEKKLEHDVKAVTPASLKIPMKSLVRDVAEVLSQPIALKSDAAGEKYPMDFLRAVEKAHGAKPLYEYKGYKETYANAADTLKNTFTSEYDIKNEILKDEILTELNTTLPPKLLPTLASEIKKPVDEASEHLAIIGTKRGEALQYITELMKEKDDAPLARLQGYEQTYADAARRIEDASTLINEKLDKTAYPKVKDIIQKLTDQKPTPEKIDKNQLTEMVDQTAKFLAAPMPEVEYEKRRLLADLMGRVGNEKLAQEGLYKVTYKEGAKELMKAPATPYKAQDERLKSDLKDKVKSVVPEKQLEATLSGTVKDAAGNLASIVKGRGEVIQLIHDKMKKEREKSLVKISGNVVHLIQDNMKKQNAKPAEQNQKTNKEAAGTKKDTPKPSASKNKYQKTTTILYATEIITDVPNVFAGTHNVDKTIRKGRLVANNPFQHTNVFYNAEITRDGTPNSTGATLNLKNPKTGPVAAEIIQDIHNSSATTSRTLPNEANFAEYEKTHTDAAKIIEEAPDYADTTRIDPVLLDTVTESIKKVPIELKSLDAKEHLDEGIETVSKYIAAVAAKEIAEGKFKTGRGFPLKKKKAKSGTSRSTDIDADDHQEEVFNLLISKLKARGDETFFKQPRNELTHAQAAKWLTDKPFEEDKFVKDSADTGRLCKKFEKKLNTLVGTSIPSLIQDAMQDVIIESSRGLAEMFMTKNNGALARDAVISEMQKHCDEEFISKNDNTESFFYAAQRLKKTKSLEATNPNERDQLHLAKKLDDMIKSRKTLRKLSGHIKDNIQNVSKYLSEHVTIPDEEINAYIALLKRMEAAGDRLLVEREVKKSYLEAANYLRELTTFEDEINREDKSLQQDITSKLQNLMQNVPPDGYDKNHMKNIIEQNAKLLTSYIKQYGEKTDALKELIEEMDRKGDAVLLRHGNIRKSYRDGANILRPKNVDQLKVTGVDPVIFRKIQLKLQTLMTESFNKYKDVMDDVVQDATSYLAAHFLEPETIQVCKCFKSVCVQCELWTKDILRHLANKCSCPWHGRLADVCPSRFYLSGTGLRVCDAGLQVTVTQCPSKRNEEPPLPCPASKPSASCNSHDATAAFLLCTSQGPFAKIHTKVAVDDMQYTTATSSSASRLEFTRSFAHTKSDQKGTPQSNALVNALDDILNTNSKTTNLTHDTSCEVEKSSKCEETATTISGQEKVSTTTSKAINDIRTRFPKRSVQSKNVFSSCTPIVTTDRMSDWHSMMVSLMWNVQAWRGWIQDNIVKLMDFQHRNEYDDTWMTFQRKCRTETLQWDQYNKYSRQLITRIASNYNNKKIVSPTRTTVKTKTFLESHSDMLEIIDQFMEWTNWLTISIKEIDVLLRCKDSNSERWRVLKEKVNDHFMEWQNYDKYLSLVWEIKFKSQISDWMCSWQEPGPVWVASACGAVPSGAVAAGLNDDEVIWVARTTHKCKVLPAALYPSKRCCILYWGGKAFHYNKYQVMCNAPVQWLAWRAGLMPEEAVQVGKAYVGRVHFRNSHLLGPVIPPRYSCHVLMFGRQVAFQCYELLVADDT